MKKGNLPYIFYIENVDILEIPVILSLSEFLSVPKHYGGELVERSFLGTVMGAEGSDPDKQANIIVCK